MPTQTYWKKLGYSQSSTSLSQQLWFESLKERASNCVS
jgi:hypothetical protein